jgi:hypothetical protein
MPASCDNDPAAMRFCVLRYFAIGGVSPEKFDGKLFLIESHEHVSGVR